jgi:hypothetical protein
VNSPLNKLGIILFFSSLFLALILHNIQGEAVNIWFPLLTIVALLAVLILVTFSTLPAKKNSIGGKPFNWGSWKKALLDILKYGGAILLVVFSVWYLSQHGNSYFPTQPAKIPIEKEKRWILSWETGPYSNERYPEMISGEFLVTNLEINEETFSFIQHYKNRRRSRVAKFFGTRHKRPRLIYSGTWSQGNVGDDDYDHGNWVLEQINATKFKGRQTDSRGEEFQMELELR